MNTETWSIFGDFTYDLTDQFAVSIGGRYTEDKRTSIVRRASYAGGFSPTFGGNGVPFATTSNFEGSATFDAFSPRVSLSYKPVDDHTLYVTYSQGLKGGSFDPRGQTTAAPDLDLDGVRSPEEIYEFMQFNPEEMNSYEIGWKSSTFNDRVQSSLAGFYMDYKDIQVPGSDGIDTDNDGVNDTFTGVTTNAGAATLWGVEFETNAMLAEEIFNDSDTFGAVVSVGYIDAQYDEFIDAFGVDVADERVFQNTPDWMGSLRLSYDTPFDLLLKEGRLTINQLTSYRSDSSQFEIQSPLGQEAYALFDLSLHWQEDGSRLGFTLTGKSLSDERFKVAGYNFINPVTGMPTLGVEGVLTAFDGHPRTFSFGVDYAL